MVTLRLCERFLGPLLHGDLVEHAAPGHLPAEEHVGDDVEVVGQCQILVDDLDPEIGGVFRAVDLDGLPVELGVAFVERVDPDDPFDQGRLAGTVVADERHHLSGADLEVDFVQRIHCAE